MNTIIKTGCVLRLKPRSFNPYDSGLPPLARLKDLTGYIIHGDLHVVGDAAVMFMPNAQADCWPKVHGELDLRGVTWFYRRTEPFSPFVFPATCLMLNRHDIHESYWRSLAHLVSFNEDGVEDGA